MKYIIAGILLIMWMTVTLILAISVLGWIILLSDNDWFEFPQELLKVFKT